jgi:4-hydroxythreonine-4-phosphate dehydrogenase
MGDPAGIGGEVILKSLTHICKKSIPVLIGDISIINHLTKSLFGDKKLILKGFKEGNIGGAEFIDLGLLNTIRFGTSDSRYGEASYKYIIEALKLVCSGEVSAIVTCPINKKSIHMAGIQFIGHTELLAYYGGVTDYVMMMANRSMRVSLVTIHIPLKNVESLLSIERIFKCISITNNSLKTYFGIKEPHIKVCGLNPHAGEQGLIGNEETIIKEAIDLARSLNMHAEGPFPADTLFHKVDCDAFIAMYHDQGIIPVKTVDFRKTVNITLGLPFIRTSPGHGTGFDIAGKGVADPSGLIEAYRVAESMV